MRTRVACVVAALLGALLSLALPSALSAQTVDEIISKYATRIGGAERLRGVTNVRRSGKFIGGGGFEAKLEFVSARPNKIREEMTLGGMTGVNAYDGKAGWKIEPWGGKKDPEALGEDETKGIVEDAEFIDPLLNYKEEGNKAELLGLDQLEGTDVYKLKLTLASNGDVRTYYLDQDSGVPIKYEVKRTVRGAEREFEVELGDYKEVKGVFFPFSLAIGAKGSTSADKQQYAWERIETNVTIDDARFAKPGAVTKPEDNDLSSRTRSVSGPTLRGVGTATMPGEQAPTLAALVRGDKSPPSTRVDSETTSGLGARNIGSAVMSGRVAAVAATHENGRLTIYVGAASGGVWKSIDGGTTFKPVFDKASVQSIGAIALDPSNPLNVWVGTGE